MPYVLSMNIKTWTVFILYDHPLFASGLETLVRRAGGVEIVGMKAKGEEALNQIRALKPDVIVVEAEKKMPESCVLFFRLLEEQPQARVVRVSLEDNTVTHYTGRRFVLTQATDFTGVLLSGVRDAGNDAVNNAVHVVERRSVACANV
jgi:chemotaxis response regulator CheB